MKRDITFVIPTLNAAATLDKCLRSVKKQNYKNKQIIIADGGSTDNTKAIAKKYKARIIQNQLKTAEAGKAIGVKFVNTDFICLLDSDNILPSKNWLKTMIAPFANKSIIGSEPWAFTYRKNSGFIERYSALIGANDPYAFIIGVSDKINHLNNRWTSLKLTESDQNNYLLVTLKPKQITPTIGANGTIFKTNFLKKNLKSKYLFDIDIIQKVLNQTKKPLYFAKVKTGIIHTFCESSIKKFYKKQQRRLSDFYQYHPFRQYNWQINQTKNNLKFIFHTIFLSPLLALLGFIKKPDFAWFFHPIACYITLFVYVLTTLKHHFHILKPLSRKKWQQ